MRSPGGTSNFLFVPQDLVLRKRCSVAMYLPVEFQREIEANTNTRALESGLDAEVLGQETGVTVFKT